MKDILRIILISLFALGILPISAADMQRKTSAFTTKVNRKVQLISCNGPVTTIALAHALHSKTLKSYIELNPQLTLPIELKIINQNVLQTIIIALHKIDSSINDTLLKSSLHTMLNGDTEFSTLIQLKILLDAAIYLQIPQLEQAISYEIGIRFPDAVDEELLSDDAQMVILTSILEKLCQHKILRELISHYAQLNKCEYQRIHPYAPFSININHMPSAIQKKILKDIYQHLNKIRHNIYWYQSIPLNIITSLYSTQNIYHIPYFYDLTKRLKKINVMSIWQAIRSLLIRPYEESVSIFVPDNKETDSHLIKEWIRQEKNQHYLEVIDKELKCTFRSIISIPSFIGRLRNLSSLDFSDNKLTFLPPALFLLLKLTQLKLNSNQLLKIPNEIDKLSELINLEVARNFLLTLPPSIGNLDQLESLKLNNNQLTQLPSTIVNLRLCLRNLYLDKNMFKDIDLQEFTTLLPNTTIK